MRTKTGLTEILLHRHFKTLPTAICLSDLEANSDCHCENKLDQSYVIVSDNSIIQSTQSTPF